MDSLKKFIVIIISLGIVAALFFLGMAFFAVALITLPIIYMYQKYKLSAKPAKSKQTDNKTIDAEYEIIEEVTK